MKSSVKAAQSTGQTIESIHDLLSCVGTPGQPRIYQIGQHVIPYVFHFSQRFLINCSLAPEVASNNPLAQDLFNLLKERITPKRKTSRTGRAPTRMKYQQKIKFVMRSLEYSIARIYGRTPRKLVKFNIQEQREFFSNFQIRKHFLEQMPKIMEDKMKSNEDKIRQTQILISDILNVAKKDPQAARKSFNTQIKQRQLPWTMEMFSDIENFFKSVHQEFIVSPPSKIGQIRKEISQDQTKDEKSIRTEEGPAQDKTFRGIVFFEEEEQEIDERTTFQAAFHSDFLLKKKDNAFLQASLNQSETADTNSFKSKGQFIQIL